MYGSLPIAIYSYASVLLNKCLEKPYKKSTKKIYTNLEGEDECNC